MRFVVVLAIAGLVCPVAAAAQIVRGTVTERSSAAPLGGVVVTLVRDSLRSTTSALTREDGTFAIRAPAAGHYHLDAKRIGVQRFSTPMFELAEGETRQVDVQLDALLYTLPEVVITAIPLCTTNDPNGGRVASLWEEARTALQAAQISLRDRLFNARLVRYVRELSPATLRVLSENRSAVQGVVDRPFYALPAESLSVGGFWRRDPEGTTTYYAPDAGVLMSEPFLDDHCFSIARSRKDRANLIGLSFEPAKKRAVGDVRGTLWLDARTFELRFVEYRYTGIGDVGVDTTQIGGEVHFARLQTGAWIVRRWFIRMPQLGRSVSPPVGMTSRAPMVLVRPTTVRLREEGGDVTAEGLRVFERPATLTGIVQDSARAPLAGARVRLSGTPYSDTTASDGSFRIDSLPAGSFDLVVDDPGYESLGLVAATGEVALGEGDSKRLTFRAMNTRAIVGALCRGATLGRDRAALRVNVRNDTNGNPLAFITLTVTWKEFSGSSTALNASTREASGTSDSRGGIAICDLPANTLLIINRQLSEQRLQPLDSLRLAPGSVTVRQVRQAPPRP